MRWLFVAGGIAALVIAVWQLTAPRLKFTFGSERRAAPGLVETLGAAFSEWLGEAARKQADALGWRPHIVPVLAAVFWLVIEFLAFTVEPIVGVIAALPAAYMAWRLAGMLLRSAYMRWQKDMVSGLPRLLTILRVHLDVGRTVPDALKAVLPGAPERLRREMMRALADIHLSGNPRDGLRRLSERVGRREWRAFADTIIQSWDARLTGEALVPLQELMAIVRDKEAVETTERLDLVLTMAPGLALFAVAIWGVGGWLVPALTGSGGIFG